MPSQVNIIEMTFHWLPEISGDTTFMHRIFLIYYTLGMINKLS